MQHFSSPSYIIHQNSHKSDNYFYSTNVKTILRSLSRTMKSWMSWFVVAVPFSLLQGDYVIAYVLGA